MGVVNLHPLISKNDRNIISITNKYNTDMKIFSKILMVLVSTILLQSCSKTYEIQFENLYMGASALGEFKCPAYFSNCRMEVETSDNFDVVQYTQRTSDCLDELLLDREYDYIKRWDKAKSGAFVFPKIKNWAIALYDNSTGEKMFALSCKNGVVISLSVWETGKLICEAKEDKHNDWPYPINILANMKYYDYNYNNNGELYIKQEEKFDGIELTKSHQYKYKHTIWEYYPTGQIYHVSSKECTEDGGFVISKTIIEDIYYKQDGSEMTMADRLFENHEEYIILSTGYTDRRDNGKFYIIFMPKEKGNTKGYGAIISSNKYDLLSIKIDRTFEYRIDDNEIICDEFFTHTEYRTERVNNQKRRTLEIDVDYDKNIIVKGEFVIKGWDVNCNMKPSQNGYSDWLYTTLQECIEER